MAFVYEKFSSKKAIIAYCRKRNESIYKFSLKGWTQRELAEKYFLTVQRVGQIIKAQQRLARAAKRKAS